MIHMYDEVNKWTVNGFTIEELLYLTSDGKYAGYVIEDGKITGVELYHEA